MEYQLDGLDDFFDTRHDCYVKGISNWRPDGFNLNQRRISKSASFKTIY